MFDISSTDVFDKEVVEHLLGENGSTSDRFDPELLRVVGYHQTLLLGDSNVGVSCSSVVVCGILF